MMELFRRHPRCGLLSILLLCSVGIVTPSYANDEEFAAQVADLSQRSLSKTQRAAEGIANGGHERAKLVLTALLERDLYYQRDDKRVVIATESEGALRVVDAVTGEPLAVTDKSALKVIGVNNSMRSMLRIAIAGFSLKSPLRDERLSALNELLGKADGDTVALIQSLIPKETDDAVLEKMHAVVNLAQLKSDDAMIVLAAIEQLKGNLDPAVYVAIKELKNQAQTPDIVNAATRAVDHFDDQRRTMERIETVYFGLSLGSVLVLSAIGLAITFGVMGVINMAHGELIMIGAYTTYVVQLLMPNHLEYSLFVAIPAAFVVSGLFGIAIERGLIRFLYGRPLETLLATFGLSLVLQQMVRSVFSPLNRSVSTPDWMSGALEINPILSLTYNRLYIIAFTIVVCIALMLVLKKTSLGLQVRAVSQNRSVARAIGIRAGWVDALTFGLGAGIAGLAGVALSQLTNVGPNLGQGYIIDSFMVVVFGGVGNLWGTVVAGMSLGVVNKFLEPATGAVMAKILVLIFIILFIQKRPQGLFPQKGRAAEA